MASSADILKLKVSHSHELTLMLKISLSRTHSHVLTLMYSLTHSLSVSVSVCLRVPREGKFLIIQARSSEVFLSTCVNIGGDVFAKCHPSCHLLFHSVVPCPSQLCACTLGGGGGGGGGNPFQAISVKHGPALNSLEVVSLHMHMPGKHSYRAMPRALLRSMDLP